MRFSDQKLGENDDLLQSTYYFFFQNSMIDDPKKAHNAHNPTAPPQSLKKPENLDSGMFSFARVLIFICIYRDSLPRAAE